MLTIDGIKVGDRFLYRGFASMVQEAVCVEFTPDRKMVKLQYPSGFCMWLTEQETKDIFIFYCLPKLACDAEKPNAKDQTAGASGAS